MSEKLCQPHDLSEEIEQLTGLTNIVSIQFSRLSWEDNDPIQVTVVYLPNSEKLKRFFGQLALKTEMIERER